MSNTNLNLNGKRVKMRVTYYTWWVGREPAIGMVHVCDGCRYEVVTIEAGIVVLAREKLKGGRG